MQMRRIPRFLVVAGAMKGGTSLLYELLREHPQIETSPIKEINYFPHVHTDLYNITHGLRLHHLKTYSANCEIGRSVQQIQNDIAFFARYLLDPVDDIWFKNLFQRGRQIYKAEFSNIVAILDTAALLHMRRIARQIRVIYIIRDPLLRLWSHTKFHNSFDWREEKKRFLNDLSVQQFTDLFHETGHHKHGMYADNIRRLRSVFSPSELRVSFYEDLVSRGQHSLDEICEFVGISRHMPAAERFVTRVNEGPVLEMPDAFVEAARPYVMREFESLPQVGLRPHADWRAI